MNPLARRALIGAGVGGAAGVAAGGLTGEDDGRGRRMLGYGLGGAALGAGAGAASTLLGGKPQLNAPAGATPRALASGAPVPSAAPSPSAVVPQAPAAAPAPAAVASSPTGPSLSFGTAPPDMATRAPRSRSIENAATRAVAGARSAPPVAAVSTGSGDIHQQLRDAFAHYAKIAPGSVDMNHVNALAQGGFFGQGADFATRQLR